MGTALASAVAAGRRPCTLWSPDEDVAASVNARRRHPHHFEQHLLPPSLAATASLREALHGAACVIVAAPSDTIRGLAKAMRPHLGPDAVVVSATKALERPGNTRLSVVLQEEIGTREVGAISGPNLSHDIVDSRPTGLIVAAERSAVVQRVAESLQSSTLRVCGTSDLAGVELAGALKNVVAIAAGIAAGLGLGDNARALLVAWGLAEIQTLASSLGARPETFMGLAGVGDLFLTATSARSRNHMVGVELGRGAGLPEISAHLQRLRETAEGIHTVRACHDLAASQRLRLPLAEAVHAVMFEGAAPRPAIVGALAGDSSRLHAAAS